MEIYLDSVRQLPAIERLRLALLILKDLTPAELAKSRAPQPQRPGADDDDDFKLVDGPG
jgi:hypothetical protein